MVIAMNNPALISDPAITSAVSTAPSLTPETAGVPAGACQVEIVVPVKDEEADLAPSIRRLHAYLSGGFPLSWHITIADNGSRDRTWDIARRLTAPSQESYNSKKPRPELATLESRAAGEPRSPNFRTKVKNLSTMKRVSVSPSDRARA